jgi:glycylpeptide N-tetradecanoyltransferase
MSRTIKLFKLEPKPATPGIRPMVDADVPKVTALVNTYLRKFAVAPHFTEQEVKHHLSVREGVVYSYVVEDPDAPGSITDFVSFYSLPSTVIQGHGGHDTLRAAYSYYNVPAKTDIKQLMEDALILARSKDFDVFNALDLMENARFLKDLKFGIGDGNLRYYLYNWRLNDVVEPSQIALVLT